MTTEANGGPAVGLYQADADGYAFTGLHLLTLAGDRVATVTAFMDGSLAAGFHLPSRLD